MKDQKGDVGEEDRGGAGDGWRERLVNRTPKTLSTAIFEEGQGQDQGQWEQAQQALPEFRLPRRFTEAAVLVTLVSGGPAGDALLFTVRQMSLPTHPGQISFPGGKRDPGDSGPEDTALREAHEELGIPRERIRVLGRLDDVPTPAGFIVTPVVGLLRWDGLDVLRPNEHEVSEVFHAPLEELARVYRPLGEREFLGIRYTLHEYPFGRHRIWGATAAMVHQLLSLAPRPLALPLPPSQGR